MQKRDLCGYQVEVDEAATRRWYEAADRWGCDCGNCRNFLKLAETNKLPLAVTQLLNELNIPPEKATYVCELHTDDRGLYYQFSYRIAGTIVDVPESEFSEGGRCCHESYPYGAPDFPEPHFDLEFFEILPWILDEAP